jgi:mutator protein MutT
MTLIVAAAVIERGGRFLVTRRQRGVQLEGFWEFPGGKCETGETPRAALARELQEELDSRSEIGTELLTTTHACADRCTELHFFRCDLLDEPRPLIGQEMRWVTRNELDELAFPPADMELIGILTAGRA